MGTALIDRYGIETAAAFRFEIWNEIDCLNYTQYNELDEYSALALKRASSRL